VQHFFACNLCATTTATYDNLVGHVRTEHEGIVDRPSVVVPCEFCGLTYSRAGLPVHVQQQHPEQRQPEPSALVPNQKDGGRVARRGIKKQQLAQVNEGVEEEDGVDKERTEANGGVLLERSEAGIKHLSDSEESGTVSQPFLKIIVLFNSALCRLTFL
jgi:hypothetical protein